MPGGFHGCEVPDVLELKGVVRMLGLDMLGLYILEPRTACGNGNLADKEVGVALASIYNIWYNESVSSRHAHITAYDY